MPPFLLSAEPVADVDAYLADGGGEGLRRAAELGPALTIKELSLARLRGRGGAGFPTGRKWSTIADAVGTDVYVACNAAEGEPGTFKDRALLRANPYQTVEGLMIAARTIGATSAFIAIKERYTAERDRLVRAVEELQRVGLCDGCEVTIVGGPDEYLFGEEKALLEVIEGKPPLPRVLPPYEHGLFATGPTTGWESGELWREGSASDERQPSGKERSDAERGHQRRTHTSNPTLVNNVETLANVPHILRRGAEWFRRMGTDESPGTAVVTVVGDVVRPGVAEVEMGTPMREVIATVGGGVAEGRRVKAVFSGVANPVLPGHLLGTSMTYEDLRAAGGGLGSAGFIVHDETACMVEVARQLSRFLHVESCGQCPPCKLGSQAITDALARIESGAGEDRDVGVIGSWLQRVTDGSRCYLATQEQLVVSSVLRSFPDEVAEHLERGACPRPRPIPLAKLVELGPEGAVYDERHYRKRPDWTYE
jgi:NADH:ubiquinone oxidoreductase subunit F (NADH-binding)